MFWRKRVYGKYVNLKKKKKKRNLHKCVRSCVSCPEFPGAAVPTWMSGCQSEACRKSLPLCSHVQLSCRKKWHFLNSPQVPKEPRGDRSAREPENKWNQWGITFINQVKVTDLRCALGAQLLNYVKSEAGGNPCSENLSDPSLKPFFTFVKSNRTKQKVEQNWFFPTPFTGLNHFNSQYEHRNTVYWISKTWVVFL